MAHLRRGVQSEASPRGMDSRYKDELTVSTQRERDALPYVANIMAGIHFKK